MRPSENCGPDSTGGRRRQCMLAVRCPANLPALSPSRRQRRGGRGMSRLEVVHVFAAHTPVAQAWGLKPRVDTASPVPRHNRNLTPSAEASLWQILETLFLFEIPFSSFLAVSARHACCLGVKLLGVRLSSISSSCPPLLAGPEESDLKVVRCRCTLRLLGVFPEEAAAPLTFIGGKLSPGKLTMAAAKKNEHGARLCAASVAAPERGEHCCSGKHARSSMDVARRWERTAHGKGRRGE